MTSFRRLFIAIALLPVVTARAADEPRIDYLKQVKPLLAERCFACHGALKQEGQLRLDTAALAVKGGESGAALKPSDIGGSLLMKRVTATTDSERMPPEGEPLKPAQIELLKQWIAQGAKAPADEQPERDPREHWAFKPPVKAPVPDLKSQSADSKFQIRNPIDAFIAKEHRARGIIPQQPADKRVWLRRVSLDLTGLPPTVAELDAFVSDQSPDAYNTVVTRLLDSPQYGARWGRHWMDIWRYSDWWGLGAEVRNSQKHVWHWRDWIVESLNADKAYDQMLREMLAADELYPNDFDRLRATGYLARQYFIFNRTSWLDETIEHSAKGMLGLTFNCAKCHDHKYDPLTHSEYYQLRAIFEPYQLRHEMLPGQTDFEKDGLPRAFDAHLEIATHLHVRGDDRNPDKSKTLSPAVPAFLLGNELKFAIEPVDLPIEATHPGLREHVVANYRRDAESAIVVAKSNVEAAKKKVAEAEATSRPEPAKPAATAPADTPQPATAEQPATPNEIIVRDHFSAAKPEQWEALSGKWSFESSKLIQTQTGAARAAMRLKQQPPTDFEAKLKYVPTGGGTYNSVGLSFDVTPSGNDVLAYVSSYAAGQKAQIAIKQSGTAYSYPANAAQNRKVELNQPHEIVLRVRGGLLNLQVDGQHSIAFRLPNEMARQKGFIELVAFDAAAEFLSFELRALPSDVKLNDASAAPSKPAAPTVVVAPVTLDQAKLALVIAEKGLKTAEAALAAIEARAAADAAKVGRAALPAPQIKEAAIAASKAERVLAALKADEEVSRSYLAVLQAAADKKPDAEKKAAAAKTAFATAQKAIETSNESYTPLAGAKKTQEDYQNRNANVPYPSKSTGRRTAFAKWLTDPRHPLPARVAVNHIWMRHFGQPLVPTVFDFGRKGIPPTHPELLDWLAVEFTEHGWSMKHLHRLMVTSETYRLSSSNDELRTGSRQTSDASGAAAGTLTSSETGKTAASIDPENRFYWRMNPTRMEAQVVRDSLLHLAGELDLKLGGPSIPINDEASRRRSLYFVHSHNDHQKFLSTFDDASVLDCYRRAQSIVPQQALALENSPLATQMAAKITQQIEAGSSKPGEQPATRPSDSEFIRAAFVRILTVEPTAEESTAVLELLGRMTAAAKAKNRPTPETAARTSLIQVLLNHNDFVTVR